MSINTKSGEPLILVFDSGLGGLTILREIQKTQPLCRLVYCSDNAAFPYGTKAEDELVERVSQVLSRLHDEFHPDIIVIACNTASTVALPKIRRLIQVPVVGVVPAIKPAAALARTPRIGLLATPGTIQRQYTRTLIEQFGSAFEWVKVGSSELVQLAENKMYGLSLPGNEWVAEIRRIVEPFTRYPPDQLDTLVLACTHFPLLGTELRQALPGITHWVDSTQAIANRVGFWIHEAGLAARLPSPDGHREANRPRHTLVLTRKPDQAAHLQSLCDQFALDSVIYL